MKLSFLLLLCCFSLSIAQAQQFYLSDGTGRKLNITTETFESEGSPYYPASAYKKATVYLPDGRFILNLQVRIDLLQRRLLFREEENEFLMILPVKKILFEDSVVFETGYPALGKIPATAYYEVLEHGKAALLKYAEITYVDSKGYSSNTVTRKFAARETFVLRKQESMQVLTNEASVIAAMADQQEAISKFIAQNELRFRKEKDFRAVVVFYNSLN